MHNAEYHVPLAHDIGHIEVVWMGASVDDAVHVQVEVIELRQQSLVRYHLVDLCVALADPAVELK